MERISAGARTLGVWIVDGEALFFDGVYVIDDRPR